MLRTTQKVSKVSKVSKLGEVGFQLHIKVDGRFQKMCAHGWGHFGGACVIFISVLAVVSCLKLLLPRYFNPIVFSAGVSASLFYWGREMRDLEKLKEMDWEGLLYPVIGIFVVTIIFLFIFELLGINKLYHELEQEAYLQQDSVSNTGNFTQILKTKKQMQNTYDNATPQYLLKIINTNEKNQEPNPNRYTAFCTFACTRRAFCPL